MSELLQIRKAARRQARLRIGVSGPSGSGKTLSALYLGKGLCGDWKKICLIDTENGSGDLYSHIGEYNVITLQAPFTPERYIQAINAAVGGGMEVVIIDSVSHEWDGKGGCLEINELIAGSKFKGNTWAAWSETTPRHQKFIEAITTAPVHVITTARSKTDTVQEGGKVKKVGLKEIQREGFEYELTLNFNVARDRHLATASKDRTSMFIAADPFVISEETGQMIKKWNETAPIDYSPIKKKIMVEAKRLGLDPKSPQFIADVETVCKLKMGPETYEAIYDILAHAKTLEDFKGQDKQPPAPPTAPVAAPVAPTVEPSPASAQTPVGEAPAQPGANSEVTDDEIANAFGGEVVEPAPAAPESAGAKQMREAKEKTIADAKARTDAVLDQKRAQIAAEKPAPSVQTAIK